MVLNKYLLIRLSGSATKQMVQARKVFVHLHYNVTPSQRHLNYAGLGYLQITARAAFNLQRQLGARVMSDVAKGPVRGRSKVLTKRIYREYIIRPRLVCKSILIKVLANTRPPVLSQLMMRDLFMLPRL